MPLRHWQTDTKSAAMNGSVTRVGKLRPIMPAPRCKPQHSRKEGSNASKIQHTRNQPNKQNTQTHKIHKHTAQDVPVGSYLKMESQPIDVTVLTTLPALTSGPPHQQQNRPRPSPCRPSLPSYRPRTRALGSGFGVSVWMAETQALLAVEGGHHCCSMASQSDINGSLSSRHR